MGVFGDLFQAIVRLFSGGGAPPEVPAKPARQQRPPVQRPQDQRHYRRKTPDDLKVPSKKPFDKQSLPQTRREGDRHPEQNQINQNNEHYVVLRAEATREGDSMAQCYRQSHEAYQQGQGALAKELSEKGGEHKRRMERLNAEASAQIFRENNLDSKPGEVDLHGLYVKEAVMYAESAIDKAQHRGDFEIRLIVGKGLHSDGQVAKIKPALEELMKRRRLPADTDPDNAGLLVVRLR
ncbi:hypothetical protein PISMIDRAFT_674559 [Pisolithus microcarpus 441]|uniref:Smr domain-containing protein n=1 Tax=Pisolithus microcarpus 441 TaxID=765257 RepID=A0A0C9ZNS3_9AGAM|nr:hypothetical protein BKA83DRAFT_1295423 [Pisolithus microcarpus]KIK27659.1 hypothetical protein PISMIDRAFT_674559 [Pisolithus microcarpus 441]